MPTFYHDSIRFHYETIGEGKPFVMCHGLTGDIDAAKALLDELPGYRLIFLDARAHGKTEPLGPTAKICFRQFAEDLHALLVHLEVERAIVGGVSMGAGIAARFAIDFPDAVQALVLIRPAWRDGSSPDNLRWAPLFARLLEQHGEENRLKAFDEHPEFQELRQKDPALLDSFRRQFENPLVFERRIRLISIPGDCPIQDWQEAEALDVPALVIGNYRDTAHPYSIAEAWAAHLPQSRLKRVTTKSIDFERHSQDVRNNIVEFLAINIKKAN